MTSSPHKCLTHLTWSEFVMCTVSCVRIKRHQTKNELFLKYKWWTSWWIYVQSFVGSDEMNSWVLFNLSMTFLRAVVDVLEYLGGARDPPPPKPRVSHLQSTYLGSHPKRHIYYWCQGASPDILISSGFLCFLQQQSKSGSSGKIVWCVFAEAQDLPLQKRQKGKVNLTSLQHQSSLWVVS